MKKLILPIISVLSLVIVVLFLDKKEEPNSTVELWKKDFDYIEFKKNEFTSEEFKSIKDWKITRQPVSIFGIPIFYVEYSIDGKMEFNLGNYNAKNLMQEFGSLRIHSAEEGNLPSSSSVRPQLILGMGSQPYKTIEIGDLNSAKSHYYIQIENKIYTIDKYLIEKLYKGLDDLRERSVDPGAFKEIQFVQIKSQSLNLSMEKIKDKNNRFSYKRWSGLLTEVDSTTGYNLEQAIKGLDIGFFMGEKEVSVLPKTVGIQMDLKYIEKQELTLKCMESIQVDGVDYFPTQLDYHDGRTPSLVFIEAFKMENILRQAEAVAEFKAVKP